MKAWNYLSSGWTNFALPTNIQKRLYKFLLRKAIGQFLTNELDLDNFDIELVNGSVELRDLDLNLQTLNECIIDTPFELVGGRVASISASLPWANFWSGDIALKMHGLHLTIQPTKKRPKPKTQAADDESPIMSSSLHFADDFLRTEMEPDQNQELRQSIQQLHEQEDTQDTMDMDVEGLQVLTRVIDKMLAKVKIDVVDTLVRISHTSAALMPPDRHSPTMAPVQDRYYLDIHIPKIAYFDETPDFVNHSSTAQPPPPPPPSASVAESSILLPPTPNQTVKVITFSSPTISIRSHCHSQTASPIPDYHSMGSHNNESPTVHLDEEDLSQTEFYEAEERHSSLYQSSLPFTDTMSHPTSRTRTTCSEIPPRPYDALLFASLGTDDFIRLTLRPSYNYPSATVDPTSGSAIKQIELLISHIRTVTTPRQIAFLLELFNTISDTLPSSVNATDSQSNTQPSMRREGSRDNFTQQLDQLIYHPLPSDPSHDSLFNTFKKPDFTSLPARSSPQVPTTASSLSSSVHPPRGTSSPDIKFKCQISKFESFFLYDDDPDSSHSQWTNTESTPATTVSHLKLALHQMIVRIQRFPTNESSSSAPTRPPSHRPPRSSPSDMKYPNPSSSVSALSSVIDFRISDISFDEWIKRPNSSTRGRSFTENHPSSYQTRYDCYNPVLEFDRSIRQDYNDDVEFPCYAPHLSRGNHHTSRVEAIRIRMETSQSKETNRFMHATSMEQETNADLQPFTLHVDPRILDRLENYIDAVMHVNDKRKQEDKPESNSHHGYGQNICKDLDLASQRHRQRKKSRIRCAFIRVLLYVPDMSDATSRETVVSDRIHADLLSVDLKKITATWSSICDAPDTPGEDCSPLGPRGASPYQRFQNTQLDSEPQQQPIKVNVEINCINVFMKSCDDELTRCWFTAKTIAPEQVARSNAFSTSLSPSFEITLRSSGLNPISSARPGYFGAGSDIPSNLFDHLNRNEAFDGEQKLHVPMEDQADSAMMFKQRTVETSLVVVNCYFPKTRMLLQKKVWDTVQIVQNDLLLWQPRFLARLPINPPSPSNYQDASSDTYSEYHGLDSMEGIHPMKASSILSQSQERLGPHQLAQESSLLALVAVIGDAVWDLCYPVDSETDAIYRAHLSEFRYFAVIKHLGMNENITTLDIDELTLDDISDSYHAVPLLYKTIPKVINVKRNTPMVSLFSRLITNPDLNKQTKMTSIVVCNLCHRFNGDASFIDNLVSFQKAPDNMVFIDPPAQYIKVYAHVLDTSIDYKPLYIPSRGVLVIDDFRVVTGLTLGQPIIDVQTYVQNIELLLIDDVAELNKASDTAGMEHQAPKSMDARKYWSSLGLSCVLSMKHLETRVKIKADDAIRAPNFDIHLVNNIITLEGCADSFQSFLSFITYITNDGDRMHLAKSKKEDGVSSADEPPRPHEEKKRQKSHVSMTTAKSENMLASVDEDTFRHISDARHVKRNEAARPPKELNILEGYYSNRGKPTPSPPTGSITHLSSFSHLARRPPKPRRRHAPKPSDDKIRVLATDTHQLEFVEDYYSTNKRAHVKKSVVDVRNALVSVRVNDFDILWKLFDGYDWAYIRSNLTNRFYGEPTVKPTQSTSSSTTTRYGSGEPMSRTSSVDSGPSIRSGHRPSSFIPHTPSFSVSSDFSFESVRSDGIAHSDERRNSYPSQAPPHVSPDARSYRSSRKHKRYGQRSRQAKVEIRLLGISVDFDLMPATEQIGFHCWLTVRDVEIIDNIETSSWKMFLGYMRPDASAIPRERDSNMVDVSITGIRPVTQDPTQELRLKIKLLPIRLYVDQDALNFLVKYFTFDKSHLRSTAATNDAIARFQEPSVDTRHDPSATDDGAFFQHVEIYPITLKVDYKAKYINYGNIKEGQLLELINLFNLDGAEMKLTHIRLTGVKGMSRLADKVGQEWLPHIKKTQVPHMVSGVGPMRSIVNIGSGVADLILLPYQQYKKDGRIVKGIQKGTQSFARATAIEAIKLSARFASGTQVILEHADGLLSSGTPSVDYAITETAISGSPDSQFVFAHLTERDVTDADTAGSSSGKTAGGRVSKFADQPSDVSQGFQYAYQSLSKNLGSAAQTIFAVPTEIRDRSQGQGNAARTVIKAVPVAVIKPMIGLTGALQSVLMGLRNSIDPVMRLQSEDKYKRRT
ncbi:uncharacterized protein BYT42DRAFT_565980 [Radiomyces spectabilis]|uniref:uncharacterized protein n=1 Tax=Radiomyces spectabilis TaxID=64574 RepID=UPI00222030D5|nr:uncharacterized protein BYT42DRAFT_565980 [Radiomyces spectabilis]KAI8381283.1 hypothetical protein BYT42DRAFT_565980 [Radiomyces spectabilis]